MSSSISIETDAEKSNGERKQPQSPQHESDHWLDRILSREKLVGIFLGLSFLILAPYLHLGFFFKIWTTKKPVDEYNCKCSCWDTIFKGSYESSANPGYHHVYFNVTPQTLKIWAVTLCYVLATYETCKFIVKLCFRKKLRLLMLIPLLASVYPHYYSWWSYFNYWNDDFYFQWNHQLFFSITELVSTIIVILMCDSSRPLHPLELLAVIDIAIVHIITSSGDQFWTNIIRNRGMWHQRVRDLGFMVPDLINVFVPAFFLWQLASQKRMPIVKMIGGQYGFGLSFLAIGFLCVLCWNL